MDIKRKLNFAERKSISKLAVVYINELTLESLKQWEDLCGMNSNKYSVLSNIHSVAVIGYNFRELF